MKKRVFLAALLALTGAARSAAAYDFIDDDKFRVRLTGWAQGGYQLVRAGGDTDNSVYLGMARLLAEAQYKPWGGAFVQLEGLSEDVLLLDIIATFTPFEFLEFRLGKFRTPTSIDQLIAAPQTPFVNRGLLVGDYTQGRRIGAELVGTVKTESLRAAVQIGIFNPSGDTARLLFDDGTLFSARTLIELPLGLNFHLAYMGLVQGNNDPVLDPESSLIRQPVPHNHLLDLGVFYVKDGFTAYFEGIVVFDGPGDDRAYGGQIWLLKLFDIADTDFDLEPGVRYELMKPDDDLTHRLTVGLNLYIIGDLLNFTLNYELLIRDGEAHTGYAQIQAGF